MVRFVEGVFEEDVLEVSGDESESWLWLRLFLLLLTDRRPFRFPEDVDAANCAVQGSAECVRNRAPPPPEGTLLQERPTWPGPPSASPPGVEEEDVQRRKDGSTRIVHGMQENARECKRMKAHQGNGEILEEKAKRSQVGISELVYFLLNFGDEAISIISFAENAPRHRSG